MDILEHILTQLKAEVPRINNVILRSDNAGCYHSSATIGTVPVISESTEIWIRRWTFSEPQAGKGPCDRMAANIKRKVRMYVYENHPATNALEFVTAASSYNGIKGVTFYVGSTSEEPNDPDEPRGKTIPGISGYLDFEFEYRPTKIKAWRFHAIGAGLSIQRKYYEDYQLSTHFRIQKSAHPNGEEADPLDDHHWKDLKNRNHVEPQTHEDEESAEMFGNEFGDVHPANQKLFECPVQGCIKKYKYYSNLQRHMALGKHTFVPERLTLRDYAIRTYKTTIEEMAAVQQQTTLRDVVLTLDNIPEEDRNPPLTKGWAIRKTRRHTVFTVQQREYLANKFHEGERTKKKCDPKQVATNMRREKMATGEPMFTPDEYLTWQQIASFFSRYAAVQRQAQNERAAHNQVEASNRDCADVSSAYNDDYTEEHNYDTIDEEIEENLYNSEAFLGGPRSGGRKRGRESGGQPQYGSKRRKLD